VWEDKGDYCDDGPLSLTSYIGMFGSLLGFIAVKAIIILRQSDGKRGSSDAGDAGVIAVRTYYEHGCAQIENETSPSRC